MPITYRIDPQSHLVMTVATGVLTDAELLDHKRRLAADPAFEPGMGQLSDIRGVEQLEVTPQGVRQFVAHDRVHAGQLEGHRLAIVAPQDLVFGMARMYQTLTDANVGVFRDVAEALAFLGRSAPAI